MKKIFLSTIMALAFVGINAQEDSPINIPGLGGIMYGMPESYSVEPYFVTNGYINNDDGSGVTMYYIYDEDLNLIKKIIPKEGYVESFYYYNMRGTAYSYNVCITQTLFNNDENFEYVISNEKDGALKIVSEDGNILQTIKFQEKMRFGGVLEIGKNNYMIFYKYSSDGYPPIGYLYKINKDTNSATVSVTTEPMKIRISPRVVERNQNITVSAEGEGVREVVVTDAAGRIVYRTKTTAGQQTVKINSHHLSSGLNVVSVKGTNGKNENCKVLVKK